MPSVKRARAGGDAIEIGDELLGFEKDSYKIVRRREGGVEVHFFKAEFCQEGNNCSHRDTPELALFSEAANARFVRLVYLVRVSQADAAVFRISLTRRLPPCRLI